jgi:methionyl-tRNA synthetase
MTEEPKPQITYEEFSKLDLRVAEVLEVQDHPNADKLLVLKIEVGEDNPRQLVAGLKPYLEDPQSLVGKFIVVVLNLEPRKMRGMTSEGMLLAASWLDGVERMVTILTTDVPVPPGSVIS